MKHKLMCCGGTHCEISLANIETAVKKKTEICEEPIRANERKKVLEQVESIMRTHIKSTMIRTKRMYLAKIADEIQKLGSKK